MRSLKGRVDGSCTSLSTGSTLFTCAAEGESTHELGGTGDSSVFCSEYNGDVALDPIPLSKPPLLSSLLDGESVCFVCSFSACSGSVCSCPFSLIVQLECSLPLSEGALAALIVSRALVSRSTTGGFTIVGYTCCVPFLIGFKFKPFLICTNIALLGPF